VAEIMKTVATKLPVNWLYVSITAAIGSVAIGFLIWAITSQYIDNRPCARISGGWSWGTVILLDVGLAATLVALYWKLYCDANTEIGENELCRPSIFGRRRIEWLEVTRVDKVGFGYHIYSGKTRIVLTPHAHRNPESVVALLRSRVNRKNRGELGEKAAAP
jgi:hypothetical protein